MWDDRYAEICARHPGLVAIYESRHGRLALLLGQTLVPLSVERLDWLNETRATARAVIADLRSAGFSSGTVVLQWLPLEDVARIVARWIRRWDGDPGRRSKLLASVEQRLADARFLSNLARRPSAPDDEDRAPDTTALPNGHAGALDEAGLDALKAWYEAMAPCWLAIQPAARRRLVLQTHVWLAAGPLADPVAGPARAVKDLSVDGPLARALGRLVPRSEAEAWRDWIERVCRDLTRGLSEPPTHRTVSWGRRLFLVPYGAPFPRRPRLRPVPTSHAPLPRPA